MIHNAMGFMPSDEDMRQTPSPDQHLVDQLRADPKPCLTPGCGQDAKVYGWNREGAVDPYCQDCAGTPMNSKYYEGWDYL